MEDRKLTRRLKSINLTKSQESYKKYLKVVPKDSRLPSLYGNWHVSTPDHTSNLTNSQWNNKLSRWRKLIHRWDSFKDSDLLLLSQCLNKGDSKGFISICDSYQSENSQFSDSYDILNSDTHLFYPVIFKPLWFKGNLKENGFKTINETEFLQNSKERLPSDDLNFNLKFMSLYSNNYPIFDSPKSNF